MSALTERLRAIVGPPVEPGPHHERCLPPAPAAGRTRTTSNVESVLGGAWRESHGASCCVVDQRRDPSSRYGRQTVGQMATCVEEASAEAAIVAGGPAAPPFIFFDVETTGLSGGAGTHAFLVGCGGFDEEGGFVTRQFLLTRFDDERPLLLAVAAELARAGALVSFNGKSFDAPILETRYLFHRLDWAGGRQPHLDVLHPARRFWRNDDAAASCSLLALEQQVLGSRRVGDVPGFEIPARYFQFVRSGDARPLAAVLEHNRLDLLSLAGLTARLLELVRLGPSAAGDAREALALGRVYARAGLAPRALAAFEQAARMSRGALQIESLRSLALTLRRARRVEAAAACWQRLLDVPACPRHVAREASEALAIHHEHRARNLVLARRFALASLDDARPGWNEAVQHRLCRIERKINGTG